MAEIVDHFTSSAATVLTEYRGLTVKQISQLRKTLGSDTTYAVVKNTLTKRAAAEAGVALDESLLTGPTAIAFVKGDPVEAAKGLRDFAKANPLLIIKGGVYEGKALSAAEVAKIADLESREVLLAKIAGVSRRFRPARLACSRPRCRRSPGWLRLSRRSRPPVLRLPKLLRPRLLPKPPTPRLRTPPPRQPKKPPKLPPSRRSSTTTFAGSPATTERTPSHGEAQHRRAH